MKMLLMLGLLIGASIAVTAWARPSTASLPVTSRSASSDGADESVAVDDTAAPGEIRWVQGGSRRRVLGVWLLAMTGTAVVLRARRQRTI
jgi:hypothetical protein